MNTITRRAWLASAAAGTLAGRSASIGFAFGTYGMKTIPTVDALRTIAGIGYDGVELCLIEGWPADPAKVGAGARRTIREVLGERRLAVPALLEALPLAGTAEKRAYNLERLRLAAGLAHDLAPGHLPCIDTVLGLKPENWESGKQRMAEEVCEWARLARSEAITIAVKPHADQAMDSPEKCVWMMGQVKSKHIRLTYDFSHMELGGFSLEKSFTELRPYIVHISVKDARIRGGKHEYLLPGDGDTDYASYFRLVRRTGYSGSIDVEVSAAIHQQPGYDPIATARLCYQRLAPAFAAAGLRRSHGRSQPER